MPRDLQEHILFGVSQGCVSKITLVGHIIEGLEVGVI